MKLSIQEIQEKRPDAYYSPINGCWSLRKNLQNFESKKLIPPDLNNISKSDAKKFIYSMYRHPCVARQRAIDYISNYDTIGLKALYNLARGNKANARVRKDHAVKWINGLAK